MAAVVWVLCVDSNGVIGNSKNTIANTIFSLQQEEQNRASNAAVSINSFRKLSLAGFITQTYRKCAIFSHLMRLGFFLHQNNCVFTFSGKGVS